MAFRSATLVAIALIWASVAQAGVTITMERPENKQTSTIYIEGNKLRLEDGRQVMIFDGDSKKIISIDPSRKTYSEMNEQQMKEMGAKMKANRDKMLEQLPPDQRKKAQERIAQAEKPEKPEKITAQSQGKKETVAGYTCEDYKILKNGKPEEEGCYIPWNAGAVTKKDLQPMVQFADLMATSFGMQSRNELATRIEQYPGIPAISRRFDGNGGKAGEERLQSLKRGPIAADKFTVPSGYTKQPPPL